MLEERKSKPGDDLSKLEAPKFETPCPFISPHTSLDGLIELLKEVGLAENELVQRSLTQAYVSHHKQRRDDGGRYLECHVYPMTASGIHHELRLGHRVSAKFVAMLLNHDVPEDDLSMPLSRFREEFGVSDRFKLKPGRSVADLVDPLTKRDPREFPGKTDQERKANRDASYYGNLENAEYESKIGKLADREQNILSLHGCERSKILRKIQETEDHYLPMAKEVSPYYFESISKRIFELKEWLAISN